MIDIHHIAERHESINARLEEWGRWVRVSRRAWNMQPIWRQYRAPRQYEVAIVPMHINTLDALETERAVSVLPVKHRDSIRWAYVFSFVPIGKIQRELAVTNEGLSKLVEDARDTLKNRLKRGSL